MNGDPPRLEPKATSPSASGPAGALFEGQVGAHYLLTMLAEADPRGLPGVFVERVELQRAGEGYPLDDVIVRGVTNVGEPSVLEVQVKRTIKFTPTDTVFKEVVEQLAQAFQKLDLTNDRHQFAVATERTSSKITGPYQDVLRWAREVGSASVFTERVARKKVGNDDMRTFVATVTSHLAAAGCASDSQTVWQILRRFHILIFDYDAPGSQSEELALERARHMLKPNDSSRASAFWKALTTTAIRVAAAGGDLDRPRLLAELAQGDRFQVLGSRRSRAPRETLSEAAALTAADLQRKVAGVTLARTAQVAAVRDARDAGRYVEIRGGPGVGKSGLLGVLVQMVLTEARAIVLSPERTIPGGWLAFKTALRVDASPQAFLSDLASDGGAVLFVDSLDFFDDPDKRATVADLVRSAAEVPSFQVIVTARTDFGKDEPNWLPSEALARLGRAPPVVVNELGDEEIEELSAAAPALRALLSDSHPARDIARNLFRLSRLLEVQGSAEELRSEVDLLERWWTTADGAPEGRRERARLLSDLSDAALSGADHLETRAAPAAVEALVSSESLREIGLDRLAFRHDVLREWGVAARLHDDPAKLGRLPLTRPVPVLLTRGVELGARLALERSSDGQRWISYINRVTAEDAHASWRRFALLAVLRSEIWFSLLERVAESLFERDAALLRELIRTTIAVESRPLAEVLAELGEDVPSIPTGIFAPSNASWARLARWLLERRSDIPLQALPDVIEIFQSLSMSLFFDDPLTPKMALALSDWLEEIEAPRGHHPMAEERPQLATAGRHRQAQKLADDLRHAFALMSHRVPERARTYLRGLLNRRNSEHVIRDIVRFRGSLARAAPAELAELTLAGLVPNPAEHERRQRRLHRGDILTHLDRDFLPSSPAQGPFLEMLNASPEHGLALIRRLVHHAGTAQNEEPPQDADGISLVFESGPRFFPWWRSYQWSRDAGNGYAIESGLMALEAWSHACVERGDALDQVIDDILGPDGSPAAYLLVAVDVLISHWPKTLSAITPFLGSPELLSLDRTRFVRDSMPVMDLLGWGAIVPEEPSGPTTLASLKKRSSRHVPLETLLGHFTFIGGADYDGLRRLLNAAAERLGSPQPGDTFAEPRLMARYALNLTDPGNWQPRGGRMAYVAPEEEAQHLTDLQIRHGPQAEDFGIDAGIQTALENPEKSSPALAEQAVAYAKRVKEEGAFEDTFGSLTNAVVSAATIVARDGADSLLEEHEGWARSVFASAFTASTRDFDRGMKDGLRFNPIAIATLGVIHLWRRHLLEADRDALLTIAGQDTAEAAHGFGAGINVIRGIDPRLVHAILRCALAAQIHPTRRWDDSEEKKGLDSVRYQERVTAAIEAERIWLRDKTEEPVWPHFPPPVLPINRSLRIGGKDGAELSSAATGPHDGDVDAKSAAQWLRLLTRGATAQDLPWLPSFINAYSDWTADANGAGGEPDAEIDNHLDEWNSIFFGLLARTLPDMNLDQASAAVSRAIGVPDRSFFDIAEHLVPALDEVYFDGFGLDLETAVRLRGLVADRLVETASWRHERNRSELSVGTRIGPAIGVLFFNNYSALSRAQCYLLSEGIDQVEPFMPMLTCLIEDGPVPFTAMLTMNLLEVARKPEHACFFLSSALIWLRRQPNNFPLWVDSGLGERLARWLESVMTSDASFRAVTHPLRPRMEDVLAKLVQVGVAEAHRVEKVLAGDKA